VLVVRDLRVCYRGVAPALRGVWLDYIVRPEASVAGGLSLVQELFAAALATSYQPAS
jgi:hypothetical protein